MFIKQRVDCVTCRFIDRNVHSKPCKGCNTKNGYENWTPVSFVRKVIIYIEKKLSER